MRKTDLPDYVQTVMKKGYKVKTVNGKHFYLYKRTSHRVPGFKNPQPKDTYVGKITPEGIIYSNVKRLDTSRVLVREYGFSYAMQRLCPHAWKAAHSSNWESLLDTIIVGVSPSSYITVDRDVRSADEYREHVAASQARLFRLIEQEHGVKKDELLQLSSILKVWVDGFCMLTSDITSAQEALLAKLNLKLEVC